MSVRDVIQAAAGASTTASTTYVEDVFSTYLYTGTGAAQTINNGIDLTPATGPWTLYTASVGSSNSGLNNLDVDSSGNVYVAYTGSGLDYLSKFDSTGTVAWSKSFTSATEIHGVKCDSSGNVYVTFITEPAGGRTPHILKYDSSGTLAWKKAISPLSTIGNRQYQLAIDSSSNVASGGTGFTSGGATTPGQQILLDPSGTTLWAKNVAGSGANLQAPQYGAGFDSAGNVYFCGAYNNGSSYGNVSKYNPAGTIQWNKMVAWTSTGSFAALVVDTSSNVYVVGGSSSIGRLVKFSSTGTLTWQMYGASGSTYNSIALHSSGDVFVTSTIGDLMRVNSSGSIVWKVKFSGGTGSSYSCACNSTHVFVKVGNATIAKLPVDGTAVAGTLNGITIGASSQTLTTDTGTASSVTYADQGALGISDSTVTEGSTSVTQSLYNQATSTNAGMVWMKGRSGATDHAIYDTARGATYDLGSNLTTAQTTQSTGLTAFNLNGFSIGALAKLNTSAATYASWTFRKAPKFFDVVTWTGNDVDGRVIPHSLGVAPGLIIVKQTSTTSDWYVYHRSLGGTKYIWLNSGAVAGTNTYWNNTEPTSSGFQVTASGGSNSAGVTYVAYLFAHDTTTDGLIQCGSFTTDGSGNASVTLGWEPQYLLYKCSTTAASNWTIIDNMRGMTVTTSDARLFANSSGAEATGGLIDPSATGFSATALAQTSATHIYMAIRRGPMRTPTDGTTVFRPASRIGSGTTSVVNTTITPDLVVHKVRGTTGGSLWVDRLRDNNYLASDSTNGLGAESTSVNFPARMWDNQTAYDIGGAQVDGNSTSYSYIDWIFKRAPGFFDVVCYTSASGGTAIPHNLSVTPELVISKPRGTWGGNNGWSVWSSLTGTNVLYLNTTAAMTNFWSSSYPATKSNVYLDGQLNGGGTYGTNFVAYLFASCPGVSKVGTYTGNGSSQTINCGFAAGARFVLIKRTDSTGDWYVWDTARGIVATTDPHLSLNTTAAEVTAYDTLDPASSGFIVNQVSANNVNELPGVTWVSRTPNFSNQIPYAVTYVNGLYVAVGGAGKLTYSSDGVTWTSATTNVNTSIYTAGYGNGLYVIAGLNGTLSTSPDLITWTSRTSGFGTTQINGVTYGNGLFVAVGNGGIITTSPDGVTWTSRTSGFGSSQISSVTYGNGIYVAVGGAGNIAYSSNAINWTNQSSVPVSNKTTFNSVIYANGLFVAVGTSGDVYTSPDGATWTSRGSTSATLKSVAYGNGVFIIVTNAGGVQTSPDGITWTAQTGVSTSISLNGVTYGAGGFVTVGYDSTAALSYVYTSNPSYIYLAIA